MSTAVIRTISTKKLKVTHQKCNPDITEPVTEYTIKREQFKASYNEFISRIKSPAPANKSNLDKINDYITPLPEKEFISLAMALFYYKTNALQKLAPPNIYNLLFGNDSSISLSHEELKTICTTIETRLGTLHIDKLNTIFPHQEKHQLALISSIDEVLKLIKSKSYLDLTKKYEIAELKNAISTCLSESAENLPRKAKGGIELDSKNALIANGALATSALVNTCSNAGPLSAALDPDSTALDANLFNAFIQAFTAVTFVAYLRRCYGVGLEDLQGIKLRKSYMLALVRKLYEQGGSLSKAEEEAVRKLHKFLGFKRGGFFVSKLTIKTESTKQLEEILKSEEMLKSKRPPVPPSAYTPDYVEIKAKLKYFLRNKKYAEIKHYIEKLDDKQKKLIPDMVFKVSKFELQPHIDKVLTRKQQRFIPGTIFRIGKIGQFRGTLSAHLSTLPPSLWDKLYISMGNLLSQLPTLPPNKSNRNYNRILSKIHDKKKLYKLKNDEAFLFYCRDELTELAKDNFYQLLQQVQQLSSKTSLATELKGLSYDEITDLIRDYTIEDKYRGLAELQQRILGVMEHPTLSNAQKSCLINSIRKALAKDEGNFKLVKQRRFGTWHNFKAAVITTQGYNLGNYTKTAYNAVASDTQHVTSSILSSQNIITGTIGSIGFGIASLLGVLSQYCRFGKTTGSASMETMLANDALDKIYANTLVKEVVKEGFIPEPPPRTKIPVDQNVVAVNSSSYSTSDLPGLDSITEPTTTKPDSDTKYADLQLDDLQNFTVQQIIGKINLALKPSVPEQKQTTGKIKQIFNPSAHRIELEQALKYNFEKLLEGLNKLNNPMRCYNVLSDEIDGELVIDTLFQKLTKLVLKNADEYTQLLTEFTKLWGQCVKAKIAAERAKSAQDKAKDLAGSAEAEIKVERETLVQNNVPPSVSQMELSEFRCFVVSKKFTTAQQALLAYYRIIAIISMDEKPDRKAEKLEYFAAMIYRAADDRTSVWHKLRLFSRKNHLMKTASISIVTGLILGAGLFGLGSVAPPLGVVIAVALLLFSIVKIGSIWAETLKEGDTKQYQQAFKILELFPKINKNTIERIKAALQIMKKQHRFCGLTKVVEAIKAGNFDENGHLKIDNKALLEYFESFDNELADDKQHINKLNDLRTNHPAVNNLDGDNNATDISQSNTPAAAIKDNINDIAVTVDEIIAEISKDAGDKYTANLALFRIVRIIKLSALDEQIKLKLLLYLGWAFQSRVFEIAQIQSQERSLAARQNYFIPAGIGIVASAFTVPFGGLAISPIVKVLGNASVSLAGSLAGNLLTTQGTKHSTTGYQESMTFLKAVIVDSFAAAKKNSTIMVIDQIDILLKAHTGRFDSQIQRAFNWIGLSGRKTNSSKAFERAKESHKAKLPSQ